MSGSLSDAAMNEFDIIRRYFTRESRDPDVLIGVGDDAAVLDPRGPIAVCVDTLVSGTHFPAGTAPDAVGHRALAVNLSDIAAMGARPRWATLALTLEHAEAGWLEAFAAGFFALADRHGVALVGGDMTRGPLAVTVQLIGTLSAGRVLMRGGGRSGDDVYVTGTLGDSAGGLALLGRNGADRRSARALVERFLRPTPRVDLGLELAGIASAAIDVSDGLVADLTHVCEASGCGAVVDVEALPLSDELKSLFPPETAEAYALGGGDDYELCFTAAANDAERVAAVAAKAGVPATRIGRLTDGAAVVCRRGSRPFSPPARGFVHF